MEHWVSDMITVVMALGTIGVFTLTGLWMTLRHRRQIRSSGTASVDSLHDELAQLREDSSAQIAELHERIDFAERLLAQQRDPALPPAPAAPRPTLRPRTPA